MEFCANCGSLLRPKKTSKKTVVLFCAKCGSETKSRASKLQKTESYVLKSHIKHIPSDKIVIESEEITTQPTTFAECEKCGCQDVAVSTRSAGAASHPGQYETHLNVIGESDLMEKIKKVWSSTFNALSLSSRHRAGVALESDPT